MMRKLLISAVGIVPWLCVLPLLLAQRSPATLPNAAICQAGSVTAIAVQNDNKILVGGIYSTVNGVTRQRVARLNSDGSLDEGWNPGIDAAPSALAVSGTTIYVAFGGRYDNATGVFRLRSSDSSAAEVVWPEVRVLAMAVHGTDLYLGGSNFLGRMSILRETDQVSWSVSGNVKALAADETNL